MPMAIFLGLFISQHRHHRIIIIVQDFIQNYHHCRHHHHYYRHYSTSWLYDAVVLTHTISEIFAGVNKICWSMREKVVGWLVGCCMLFECSNRGCFLSL